MTRARRILIVADFGNDARKVFLSTAWMLAKGFIRLGHDVQTFNYGAVLRELSPIKSKGLSSRFYKGRVDALLVSYVRQYEPDIVYVAFPRAADADTIRGMRSAAPASIFVGGDGDPWPERKKQRIEVARQLDILTATNDGTFLASYRQAGVPCCIFVPNFCDPDVHHRYEVEAKWECDILWTGSAGHGVQESDQFRAELVRELSHRDKCSIYGCVGKPRIGGMSYLYAISGARIGLSVNAINNVRLYHSDRLTHYLACGTFVLAKRVPDTDLLFKDGVHLRYFDTREEFFDLAKWYLEHPAERQAIAAAGMERTHAEFNCTKVAQCVVDIVETGSYAAAWVLKV